MKKIIYTYFTPLIVCCLLCCCTKQQKNTVDFTEVEKNFKDIPADIQTSIYWYWINDNISQEAVIKDLHSMKEVGINRAFIGNIGLSPQEAPYGKVKIFTDEWWDIMHTALKTATELNIEIGLFNSPGWSQSGGPWIKPEQAMRYLTCSEVKVKGPKKLQQHLAEPTKDFQDVKVIAMPVNKDYLINLLEKGTYTISPSNIKADLNTGKELTFNDKEITIDITLPKEATARSLVLYPAERPIRAKIELQVQEGDSFKNIKQFTLNRTNPALNVGFEPYAPVAISLPEVKDQKLRLVMEANPGSGIKRILLSPSPVMERFAEKSLAKMHQTPLPYWHDYLWDEQPDVTSYKMAQPNEILDISGYMDDQGLLTWDVPEGEWIIMRTGMTPTGVTNSPASPEGTGLEVDKMSKEHVASHFDAYLGMILERIPADDRKTLKVAVQDSYETGGQNFTDDFLKEFQKRYGYDPVPALRERFAARGGKVLDDAKTLYKTCDIIFMCLPTNAIVKATITEIMETARPGTTIVDMGSTSPYVIQELHAAAVEKGFYVVSDEIYEKLIYDGEEHVSIASLGEDIFRQTIVINGVSKSYAMTGWRIGYTAGPIEVIRAMSSLQSQVASGSNSIAQYAAEEALRSPKGREAIERMHRAYDERRRHIVRRS